MHSGDVAYFTVDSLSAFWPGLQVLAGDVQSAIKLHLMCQCVLSLTFDFSLYLPSDYNLWQEHSGLPEVFDTNYKRATSHQYPLRPGWSACSFCAKLDSCHSQNLSNLHGTYTV